MKNLRIKVKNLDCPDIFARLTGLAEVVYITYPFRLDLISTCNLCSGDEERYPWV